MRNSSASGQGISVVCHPCYRPPKKKLKFGKIALPFFPVCDQDTQDNNLSVLKKERGIERKASFFRLATVHVWAFAGLRSSSPLTYCHFLIFRAIQYHPPERRPS